MKFHQILLCLFSGLLLTSCKYVRIKEGRIPEQYLPIAKKYEGTYVGAFQGRKGAMKFELQGTKAVLSFLNGHDNDILGSECDSVIGELTYLKLGGTKEKPVLRSASFKFDPGSCRYAVDGRTLEIYDSGKALEVEILEQSKVESNCRWQPGNPPNGGGTQVCDPQTFNIYLNGSFKKQD